MLRALFYSLAATFLAISPLQAQGQLGDTQDTREYPIQPGDDAGIGLPFDTVTGTFLSPNACIQGFSPATKPDEGGTFVKRLLQVSNTLDVMQTLNIDVSASVLVFGTEVGGKMGFAKNSEIDQTQLNYTLYAHYDGAPIKMVAKGGKEIRLKPKYLNMLKNGNEAGFRAQCGDSYVRMNMTGASAYAIFSFLSTDENSRTNISAAMQAKGTGWSGASNIDSEIKSQSENNRLEITYSQTGGSPANVAKDGETPVETDWDTLKKLVDGLNQTRDTVVVGYQVQSYNALITNEKLHLKPSPDLLKLAYYRGAYRTLLHTIKPLDKNPTAAEFTHVLGRNSNDAAGDGDSISNLRADIRDTLVHLKDLYTNCANWTVDSKPKNCKNTNALNSSLESSVTDPYVFMSRFPLRMNNRIHPTEAFLDKAALASAIFDQNHATAAKSYCDLGEALTFDHPGCLKASDLRAKYLGQVESNVTDQWEPAPRAYQMQSLHRRDNTCLTAHAKGSDDNVLYMKTCASDAPKAKQRFAWQATGQLQIREDECIAGPINNNAGVSPHNCRSKEGQQMWRFIPLDRKPGTLKSGAPGLLQEAGFGRCLNFGTPKAGAKTYVRTTPCNLQDSKQQWTFIPK